MNDTVADMRASRNAYRRIVIGFDHHVESRTVLDAAARVAAAGELELVGIFVEDADLFGLAGLPFSTEFLVGTRRSQCFDLECVERELRAQVGATQRALREAAVRVRRAFSFRTVRGRLVRTLIAEAAAGDLIMLRRADRPWSAPVGAVRAITGGPVAIVGSRAEPDGNVAQLARKIASDLGQDLIALRGTTPEDIERAAREAGAGLIILPLELLSDPAWEQGIEGFADRVPCAVLIASPPRSQGQDAAA